MKHVPGGGNVSNVTACGLQNKRNHFSSVHCLTSAQTLGSDTLTPNNDSFFYEQIRPADAQGGTLPDLFPNPSVLSFICQNNISDQLSVTGEVWSSMTFVDNLLSH